MRDMTHIIADATEHLPASVAEGKAAGRKLRRTLPRRAVATLAPRSREPLAILDEQNATRLQDLVPVRAERMSQSAFAFYRGSAAVMAADLADEPHTGILVPSCGDAHVANFGFYASPQRTLMFDLNDFDESAWAPWEWDLKRLVASVVLAGRATARDEAVIRSAVTASVRAYAAALAIEASPLDRFYAHFDAEAGVATLPPGSHRTLRKAIKHAKKRTGDRAVKKLTEMGPDGRLRFVPAPPMMQPLRPEIQNQIFGLNRRYLDAVSPEIRNLMQHYVVTDAIRRVVGVGSVGTRCALTLLQDGDGHALIMQSKEANRSVLEQYGKIPQPRILRERIAALGEGARVVGMQRILQAASDPFLGYLRADGVDLYVRQFHDMKGGFDMEVLDDEPFVSYAGACGVILARAHSQSPFAAIISGYLGSGRTFSESLWEWGNAYADRAEADHAMFVERGRGQGPATASSPGAL